MHILAFPYYSNGKRVQVAAANSRLAFRISLSPLSTAAMAADNYLIVHSPLFMPPCLLYSGGIP